MSAHPALDRSARRIFDQADERQAFVRDACGRPYFVMELVRDVPITRYCDEARLSTRVHRDTRPGVGPGGGFQAQGNGSDAAHAPGSRATAKGGRGARSTRSQLPR